VTRPEQFEQAALVGARFAVSPGLTPSLAEGAAASGLAYLPGVATVSEALAAGERGLTALKFFPAEQSGGIGALKAIAPVLPEVAFCPTGGVTAKNAPDYLALPNVFAVGGSWVAPQDLVEAEAWGRIKELAETAAASARAA
jgi:2-dehydro-3-deoxyphosphogluconate aldolase/(4S)-4-hydroxy-2-oxoglutarate aldolase